MLASTITEIPGASRYFSSEFITYSNQSKVDLLDIDPAIINQFGAVSEKIVPLMAMKCRQKTKTSISIALDLLARKEVMNVLRLEPCIYQLHCPTALNVTNSSLKVTVNKLEYKPVLKH